MDLPLLSLIVFLPAAGALVILILSDHAWVKWTALLVQAALTLTPERDPARVRARARAGLRHAARAE